MIEPYYNSKTANFADSPNEVQGLLNYWKSKCQEGNIPLRGDIEPWDFPKQLGRICLIEVTKTPLDFIYRIDGTNTSMSATSDLRNDSILNGEPKEIYAKMYEDLKYSAEKAAPILWHIEYGHDKFEYNYLRLVLPLNKNQDADTLMTFSYNLNRKDGMFDVIR